MSYETPKGYRAWRYHPSCPEGKIFWSDEAPEGWVDTPAKLKDFETPKKKVTKKKAKKKVAKRGA